MILAPAIKAGRYTFQFLKGLIKNMECDLNWLKFKGVNL